MDFSSTNQAFDAITAPLRFLPPVASLALLSLASAFVLLTAFKKLSNQEKIRYHKNKIFGHFLEIAIFRDQFSRTIICQLYVLKHNLLYMRYFMTPILVMMIPMSIICLQLDYRIGSSPLEPGDSFIIQAILDQTELSSQQIDLHQVSLTTTENIAIESGPIRIPSLSSIYWRATLNNQDSTPAITLSFNDEEIITKPISTEMTKLARFSTEKRKIKSLTDLLYSAEQPIPPTSKFLTIRTDYQAATYPFLFWRISPIIYFFILTLGFGLLLKPIMKVNI